MSSFIKNIILFIWQTVDNILRNFYRTVHPFKIIDTGHGFCVGDKSYFKLRLLYLYMKPNWRHKYVYHVAISSGAK